MAKKNTTSINNITDCACVIHGDGYDWVYVEHLYNMLTRCLPDGIRFHVYTEPERVVPDHMIKHELQQWPGISGPKKSWWYKMQLFNPEYHRGNLLYLDLDVVVVRELSWVKNLNTDYFWGIRDFRYLQKSSRVGINSSMMWWNVDKFSWVWDEFVSRDIQKTSRQFPGDQDFLTSVIDVNKRRYFEDRYFESYRWQVCDGGYNFASRAHFTPGKGAKIASDTAVVVFHGNPKPHQVADVEIRQLWR